MSNSRGGAFFKTTYFSLFSNQVQIIQINEGIICYTLLFQIQILAINMKIFPILLLILLFAGVFSQDCTAHNQQECKSCGNYYFFDEKCLPCDQAKDQYLCQQCKGYYYQQKKCLPCRDVVNPSLCEQCSGYFFGDGKCLPCEIATPYMCSLQCQDYYLNKGLCTHCTSITDQLTCKFCVGKFEFKEGKCIQCPKHYTNDVLSFECLSCSGLTHPVLCKTCSEHFFFNSTCQKCINAKTKSTCMLCPQFFFNGSACKHCNEARQKQCSFCSNHVFMNGFCVPCRLVNNSEVCVGCKEFRYSTDRMMCVPCQKKGYFLNEQNTCQHCLNANNTENCNLCPNFSFDRKDRGCLNCSEINDPSKCQNCLGFFYSRELRSCRPCENATMIDCLVNCKDHFYKNNCTNCLHARSIYECKNCGSRYYWSNSGKCLFCVFPHFFIRADECVPCSLAKNALQCEACGFHLFSKGKCMPCKSAKTISQCNSCRSLNFFFTARKKCELCVLAAEKDCNYQKCPGFLFHQSKCMEPQGIVSKSACLKHPFFSFNLTEGCKYCVASNQFQDPITNICFKCQSFKNILNCSKCLGHYFDKSNNSCMSCPTTRNQTLCSLCASHVFLQIPQRCMPCKEVTKKSDCLRCKGYIYRKGTCVQCKYAESNDQCQMCEKHGFQQLTCVRCERIISMNICEKQCTHQGYYPARNIALCLSCDFAENQLTCSNCITHSWSIQAKKCLSCNTSEIVCQSCGGKYWKNNLCKQCDVSNCYRCTPEGSICTQCRTSYLLSVDNQTCSKNCKANFCSKCAYNSQSFCEVCHPDYNFEASKGLCSLECLVTRCLTCFSNSICQICEQGYSLSEDRSQCFCSIKNCDSCGFSIQKITNATTSKMVCNRCLLGYQYDSVQNVCNKIQCQIQSCRACRNLTACQVCQLGWNTDSNRLCKKICNISLCAVCSSPKTCETCVKGYKLINDKQCLPFCNIKNCIKCKNEFECQTCELEYSINRNRTKCELFCPTGLLIRDGMCQNCQKVINFCERCMEIQKKAICSKCISGYLSNNVSCSLCNFWSPNCNNCTQNSSNIVKCFSCSFGYSLINSKCSKCASNCHNCTKNGQDDCDNCIQGYVYNTNSFNEIKCIPCLNNCLRCDPSNISLCLACMDTYYLKQSTCKKCPSNCKRCNETSCFLCQENYFLNDANCFVKRTQFCLVEAINSNKSYCKMCKSGYELNEFQCKLSKCSESSSCRACPEGQYLSNGLCMNCPTQKCQKCNEITPGKCLTCLKGYFLQKNSQCSQCSATCESCTSKSSCRIAAKGYFLQLGNEKPVKCPNTCQSCNNSYVCLSCSKGYFLFKFKCLSEQSINMTITVTPLSKEWQRLNKTGRYQNLLQRWNFYYSQLLKLIGYQNRWNLVYVNSVVTGSITYKLIIDKLPSEDILKVTQHIDDALNTKSDTLQLISYQKEVKKKQQSSRSSGRRMKWMEKTVPLASQKNSQRREQTVPPTSSSSSTLIIVLIVLASIILCVIAFMCIKRLLTTRIAPTINPKIDQQSYNQFVFDRNPQKISEGSNGSDKQSNKQDPPKKSQISQQLPKLQNHTQVNSQ